MALGNVVYKGDRVFAFYSIQGGKRVYSPAKVRRVHREENGNYIYRVQFYKNKQKKHVSEVIEMEPALLIDKRYKNKSVPDILLPNIED